MRIRIDAAPVGPLKVLREFPDSRLAILEGLNGIGKTLAVRLLEVCTGELPYALGSPAWKSLCDGLGEFRVVASGLKDGREIHWHGDSREWDVAITEGLTPVRFREIEIDGRSASLDEVRAQLAVHRVGGDEGIVDTLAQQADLFAETVRRWTRRYTAPNSGPLASLEAGVSESMRLLSTWSLEGYRSVAASGEDARLQGVAATKAVDANQLRRNDLATASELRHRLEEMRRRAPDLDKRLQTVDDDIKAVEAEREEVQRRVRGLAGQVAASAPVVKELANARRTVERNRERLSSELNQAAAVAADLGVKAEPNAVDELIDVLKQEVTRLTAERVALDSAPAMRALLDGVTTELADAESQGLGDQVAIDDPVSEIQLSVTQTRAGMVARRAFLEGKPPPPQAQELTERLERTKRSLDRANQLRWELQEADRYRRLVAHNEDRVNVALSAINPHAVAQMQALEKRRRESDDRLLQLASERAALRQQLGTSGDGTTERALGLQLSQVLERLGVTESQLDDAYSDAETVLQRSQLMLTQAQDKSAEVRRELARAGVEIRRAIAALTKHEQLAWVRGALPRTALPAGTDTPQQQLKGIDLARERVVGVDDRLGNLRGQLGGVESALRGVGRRLRSLDPEAVEYLPELQSWLGAHFSAWFNNARIRRELLPTAEGDVVVDVASREVIWTESGHKRSRPLQAFSSGEQAFAYTRARMAVLDEEEVKPANRLIVLDEFGAFIAHDRLAGLLAYLQDRSKEHPNDQVLVILPLSRDYAELAKTAVGSDAKQFGSLAGEVASRSYAVRLLDR